MIFLIQYDRRAGKLVTFREFERSQRGEANTTRLALELDLHAKGVKHEVVLLEAESKDALQQTHKRYFADLAQLLKDGIEQAKAG